jgi:hypothetical protein
VNDLRLVHAGMKVLKEQYKQFFPAK